MTMIDPEYLQAPFPYFGGKSKIAAEIWQRLGDVPNYVEPFFGSGAVLWKRPLAHLDQPRTETVNDKDGYVANFWRAVQADAGAVAKWADWPANENDLHARHAWLVGQHDSLAARLEGDPDYYDTKIAGYWVWGLCLWIGSGFCSGKGPWKVVDGQLIRLGNAGRGINRQLIHLGNAGMGINRQLIHLGDAGRGINKSLDVSDWFTTLQARLRRVRVCSGDWTRVTGPSVTTKNGVTGMVFDPPYDASRAEDLYRVDNQTTYAAVRQWCIDHGDDPLLRIAYCGYEDGYQWPANWTAFEWKAQAGYGTQRQEGENPNRHRERVWFSPHCLAPDAQLVMF